MNTPENSLDGHILEIKGIRYKLKRIQSGAYGRPRKPITDDTFNHVVLAASNYFGDMNPEDFFIKNMNRKVTNAKHVCMFILSITYNFSTLQIADFFNTDHSTVVKARQKIWGFINSDLYGMKEATDKIYLTSKFSLTKIS